MQIKQVKRQLTDFQQPINEYQLKQQVSIQLSSQKVIRITELAAGQFNNTYLVETLDSKYVLKIAPHENADVFYSERNLMRREQTVASNLESASLLVPRYLSFFSIDGRVAFLQPYIEGRLWHDNIDSLSKAENSLLWYQLGHFASELHKCVGSTFGYPAPSQCFSRWSEFIRDNVEGLVDDSHRLSVYCSEIENYLMYLPLFTELLDRVDSPRLLHGDIWPRNVIYGGEGENIHIKAVIDGERAYWGHPISDWVLILYDVPEAFWQGYGSNLLKATDPRLIAIYQGMYFLLNILEAVRFGESDIKARQRLSGINDQLNKA